MNKDIEIRGFIYADGCFQIIKQNRKRYYKDKVYEYINYIPRINITQRADNLPFLKEVQQRYGGTISENKSVSKKTKDKPNGSNPVFYWTLQSFSGCKEMLDFLVKPEWFYAKENSARTLWLFCKFRLKLGQRKFTKTELKKCEGFHQTIRYFNSYHGVT